MRPIAIDLALHHRRSVASLHSNLVTRPTGRAVRMGVESQLAEVGVARDVCLSVLDFSQVRVLDFSCADEIVAKLLLRYTGERQRAQVYFVVRGLSDHHAEAIQAVLERHGLLVVAERTPGRYSLLGTADRATAACWELLLRQGTLCAAEAAVPLELTEDEAAGRLAALAASRVAVALADGSIRALPTLATGRS